MKMRTVALLIATHCAVGIAGFGADIYALPILTAPPAPSEEKIKAMSAKADYTGQFRKDLKDSDALHWGEGTVSVNSQFITLMGKLAPGPDYKLYLVPEFVQDESSFLKVKDMSMRVGDVKTFEGFLIDLPADTEINAYTTVLVWCEAFGEFITAGKYR